MHGDLTIYPKTVKMPPKVRLVRCPKCAKILPEPTEVPLYTCGGCDTVLQAKYYKREDDATSLSSNEAVPDHEPSSDAPGSVCQNKGDDQIIAESSNGEQPGVAASVSEASSSDHSLPVKSKEPPLQESKARANVEVVGREPDVNENGNLGQLQDSDSASEANQLDREDLSQIVPDKGGRETNVDRNNRLDQTKVSESAAGAFSSHGLTHFKTEELSRADMPNGEAGRMALNAAGDSFRLDQVGDVKSSSPWGAPFVFKNKESSEAGIASGEVDRRGQIEAENFSQQKGEVAKPNTPHSSPDNSSLRQLESSDSRILENRLQNRVTGGEFGRRDHVENAASSIDAFSPPQNEHEPTHHQTKECLRLAATNKEVQGRDGVAVEISNPEQVVAAKLPREPISSKESNHLKKDSPGLLAIVDTENDGAMVQYNMSDAEQQCKSISGETGLVNRSNHHDEDEPSNIAHGEVVEAKYLPKSPTRQSFAYDGSVSSYDGHDDQVMDQNLQLDQGTLQGPNNLEYLGGGGINWDDVEPSHSEIQQQANGSSRQATHHAAKGSHPRRDRRRSDGELLSGCPFDLRKSHLTYESSCSSNYVHDEFHYPLIRPPPNSWYEDRRIYPDAYWKEKELPMYSNHGASGEIYHDLVQRYSRQRRLGNYRQQSYNYARIPYSGEAMSMPYMYPIHDPFLHHQHPEEVRWAPHLPPPPPVAHHSRSLRTAQASHRSWDPYDLYAASPAARYMDAESYGQDILSDDQRHRDDMRRRLYLRKKNQPAQQYFRPMAGGAPFITCYLCYELLQLPSDFLLFKRRSHQLKCGACSRMLKFSLEDGRYLVPYVPNDRSTHHEAVENDATKSLNPGTLYLHQRVNSRRSSSGGGSRVIPAGIAQRIRQTPSEGQDKERRDRDELESYRSKGKNIVESDNAAASASIRSRHAKVTWEPPPRSTSPLHRLMGYASPSQVLYGSGSEELEREQGSTN